LDEQEQRDYVRDLARQVAEIAGSERNQRVIKRWKDVNALRKPDRAPVWCCPVGAWSEILPDEALLCTDPWLRSVESGFRRTMIKQEIGDDEPVNAWFGVGAAFDCEPVNTWGVDIGRHSSGEAGGAWTYDPPLKSVDDLSRVCMPVYTYNEARTRELLERAEDLLGDILPVRLSCGFPLNATLCSYAADLMGLSEMMMDVAVDPAFVHRLMAYLRDAVLGAIDQIEATGLLSPNNTGAQYCSDDIGAPGPDGRLTCANLWTNANSQEFDQVSPAMWEEFLLAYQMPILERFGLSAYGCCENLTHKIDGVLRIPNLRIFVCSAWTDLDRVIERVGTTHTIMWRQKASEVVFPDDTDGIRRHLDDGARRLKGCRYQIVLRELQTLAGHPNRLHEFTRLAIEAAERNA
jgi:hypothetical protein